jgi:hypothetical protein
MTNQQIKERLAAVFNALNAVEVKGMTPENDLFFFLPFMQKEAEV